MSLVEVSPSTVTRLKVRATTSRRASSESISWVMAQSVVMKQSMVPMLGWIIPEPLAMAPRVTVFSTQGAGEKASSFFTVSVVMMARAASRRSLPGPAVWPASRRGHPGLDGGDVDGLADDACRGHGKVLGGPAGGLGGGQTHGLGVLVAHGTAGVGVAAVCYHAPGYPVLQVVHGDVQGGRLHPVEGIGGSGGTLLLREDQGEVVFIRAAAGLDAAVDAGGHEALCGADAARYLFHSCTDFLSSKVPQKGEGKFSVPLNRRSGAFVKSRTRNFRKKRENGRLFQLRLSPSVSSKPSIRFMFCTAAPLAPLPRLSKRAVTVSWPSLPATVRVRSSSPALPAP